MKKQNEFYQILFICIIFINVNQFKETRKHLYYERSKMIIPANFNSSNFPRNLKLNFSSKEILRSCSVIFSDESFLPSVDNVISERKIKR